LSESLKIYYLSYNLIGNKDSGDHYQIVLSLHCIILNEFGLWTGSINGVKLQVWATWLFYAVLIDLADAVADELSLPFDRISIEMVFRGLYHFSVAYDKGKADDPVKYLAAPENQDLGIVKALRKPVSRLNLSPFPAPS